jgi:hypothetical protein
VCQSDAAVKHRLITAQALPILSSEREPSVLPQSLAVLIPLCYMNLILAFGEERRVTGR